MTDIFKITLTKSDLNKIPPDERAFYLIAGQLANDINILGKLAIFSCNKGRSDQISQWAALTQTFLLIKIFAGRLFEGHLLISKLFLAKKLRDKYLNELNPNARTGLNKINQYFGKKNAIECVRNKFAFHYDVKEVDNLYAQLPADAPFIDLLSSRYVGHNLFYGAEVLSFHAMAEAIGLTDTFKALDILMRDTTQVATWMGNFITDFIGLMREKYINVTLEDAETITITVDFSTDEIFVPFFCGPPLKKKENP